MKREEVLTEALPHIQQFHGKTMASGWGYAMVDGIILDKAISDVVLLLVIKVVLAPRGGPDITEKMKALGKQPKFVGGLRSPMKRRLRLHRWSLSARSTVILYP